MTKKPITKKQHDAAIKLSDKKIKKWTDYRTAVNSAFSSNPPGPPPPPPKH